MSEAVTALKNARYEGYVTIEEIGPRGMITLRGDLASSALGAAVKDVTGLQMPAMRGINGFGENGALWMSPDELMLLCPYRDVSKAIGKMTAALQGEHALVADVSDARALFRLTGSHLREVLAKLAPVDMSPETFDPGTLRRTRLAQVPAAIWMEDNATGYLICFRSVADYVFDLLSTAAQPGGEVGFFDA